MSQFQNPIFIVGLHRTGSTLWHNIIAMNPEIFRLTEISFLHPFRKDFRYFLKNKVGNLSNDRNINNMIGQIFSEKTISGIDTAFWRFENIKVIKNSRLKDELYEKIKESDKSYESIFKILVEEITKKSGYNRFCVKFPVYVNYIPKLIEWYPGCKIVHIIRDPRAMSISRTNDPGGTALKIKKHQKFEFFIKKIMILFSLLQYIWTSKLHSKYKIYENYALFKFEDLLADPEIVVKRLCDFTEIEFKIDMLDLQKGRHEHQASSITGKKQKKIDKKAAFRWEKVITPVEKLVISAITKSSMKRFEYDPENHPVFKD